MYARKCLSRKEKCNLLKSYISHNAKRAGENIYKCINIKIILYWNKRNILNSYEYSVEWYDILYSFK